jgi:hypothetical protein
LCSDRTSESSRGVTRSQRSKRRRTCEGILVASPKSSRYSAPLEKKIVASKLIHHSSFLSVPIERCCRRTVRCLNKTRHDISQATPHSEPQSSPYSHVACMHRPVSPRLVQKSARTPRPFLVYGIERRRSGRPTPNVHRARPLFSLPLLFYIRTDTPLLALYCGPGGRVGNLQRTSARSTQDTRIPVDAWPRRKHAESTYPGGICPGGKGIPGGPPGNPGGRNPGGMLRAKSERYGHYIGPTKVPMK